MNILPKKNWHVRKKENIARVRRDEAQAAELEKERLRKIQVAEKEARVQLMREKSRALYPDQSIKTEVKKEERKERDEEEQTGHINFFKELEDGLVSFTGTNKEYEKEKKEDGEKYEKQIGFLTYLGQDTVELTGNVSWFNKVPERLKNIDSKSDSIEVAADKKDLIDPLKDIKRYLGTNSSSSSVSKQEKDREENKDKSIERERKRKREDDEVGISYGSKPVKKKRKRSHDRGRHSKKKKKKRKKHKKNKHKSSDSGESSYSSEEEEEEEEEDREAVKKAKLEALRAQRLQREAEESLRAKRVLAKLTGETLPEDKKPTHDPATVNQKYHSQFNPHLAKQNFTEDANVKKPKLNQ